MTVESRLRVALREAAGGIVPAEPQWEAIASRVARRDRRRRRLATTATTLAALVVVGAVLLSLRRGDEAGSKVRTAGPAAATVVPTTAVPTTATTPATAPPVTPPTTAPPPATTIAPGPVGGPVPAGFRPVSVTWISLRQGWVIGAAPCASPPCTSLLRTTDGGATWAGVPAPRAALSQGGAVGVSRIRFADESNGWAFGPELWATHDGGVTWHAVDAVPSPTTSLEASAGRVYAVAGSPAAHVFASDVGRDGWQQVGADEVVAGGAVALHGTTGYVQGTDGVVRGLSAGGSDRRSAPCGTSPASGLAAAGSDVVAVCVSDAAAGSSTKTVVVSHDGARTWAPAGTGPRSGQPSGLAATPVAPPIDVLATSGGISSIWRSEDAGATWTTVYTDTASGGAGFVDLGFTDATHGVAVEGGAASATSRLLVTADGGRTWAPATFGP